MTKNESIRADKWLWVCRFFKTRLVAAKMIKVGKIRLNGQKLKKASSQVKVGDVITVAMKNEILVVKVLTLPLRRGSAKDSHDWYENL